MFPYYAIPADFKVSVEGVTGNYRFKVRYPVWASRPLINSIL